MTVEAINLAAGRALMSDGHEYPITHMYDACGDETNDPREAASCVIEAAPVAWWTVSVADFVGRPH